MGCHNAWGEVGDKGCAVHCSCCGELDTGLKNLSTTRRALSARWVQDRVPEMNCGLVASRLSSNNAGGPHLASQVEHLTDHSSSCVSAKHRALVLTLMKPITLDRALRKESFESRFQLVLINNPSRFGKTRPASNGLCCAV